MRNREKNAGKQSSLRYVNLSVEPTQPVESHASNRGRPTQDWPQDPECVNSEIIKETHVTLQNGLEGLTDDEYLDIQNCPSWIMEASKELIHSAVSPVFVNKLLSINKTKQKIGEVKLQSRKTPLRPFNRETVQEYRPNRTHQYLTATELRDQAILETDLKYGRPTRTTLLRARNRSKSAPVNAYELRREMTKKLDEIKANLSFISSKEFIRLHSINGKTFHAFITGARYNRAHCIDAKSLTMFGIYMPRSNPSACFVTSVSSKHKETGEDSVQTLPSDFHLHGAMEVYQPVTYQKQSHSIRPPSSPFLKVNKNECSEVRKASEISTDPNGCTTLVYLPVVEDIVPMSNVLNIKGNRIFTSADTSVKFHSPQTAAPVDDTNKLPNVYGIFAPKQKNIQRLADENVLVNPVPPSPPASPKEASTKIGLTNIMVTTQLSAKDTGGSTSSSNSEADWKQSYMATRNKTRKKLILADRSINVPSLISGEDQCVNLADETAASRLFEVDQARSVVKDIQKIGFSKLEKAKAKVNGAESVKASVGIFSVDAENEYAHGGTIEEKCFLDDGRENRQNQSLSDVFIKPNRDCFREETNIEVQKEIENIHVQKQNITERELQAMRFLETSRKQSALKGDEESVVAYDEVSNENRFLSVHAVLDDMDKADKWMDSNQCISVNETSIKVQQAEIVSSEDRSERVTENQQNIFSGTFDGDNLKMENELNAFENREINKDNYAYMNEEKESRIMQNFNTG